MKYGKFLLTIAISLCFWQSSFADQDFVERHDVKSFIHMMVTKHKFNQEKLTALFEKIQLRPEVIAAMNKPYEAQPWYIYQKHFLSQNRIDGGVAFWKQHQKTLSRAEKQYGVPAQIIVAIIGVESLYGEKRGKYSVLDTLATIGFDYPSRATFFQKELAEFLILSREQDWDPATILGSYAGAVGQPQFMPSSYRAYAVDFSNKRGHADLFDNEDDVIGSIANYMHKNGWQRNGPIYSHAIIHGNGYKKINTSERKPTYTISELKKLGVEPAGKYFGTDKALFFNVEAAPQQFDYWIGFNNFYVITRYNTSKLYALAVSQLADKIALAYKHPVKKS